MLYFTNYTKTQEESILRTRTKTKEILSRLHHESVVSGRDFAAQLILCYPL